MNLFDFIYYPFVALLLYVLIAPIVRLTLLKLKYGNSVGIYYFPFIGLIGQIIFDAIIHQDVFYTQKRLKLKNPNLKLHISSDLKGGVHYSLVDPNLKRLVYSDHESYRKISGIPFEDVFLEQGMLFQVGQTWVNARKLLTSHFSFEELRKMIYSLKAECLELQHVDGPLDILSLTKIMTSNVITKAFFGIKNTVTNLGKEVNDNQESVLQFLLNPLVVIRCFVLKLNRESTPKFLLSSGEKLYLKKLLGYKVQVVDQIKARIAEIEAGQNPESNVLTTLASEIIKKNLDMEAAVHQFFTLLIAGIDTTSHTIKNCCYALAKHKECQVRLREEVRKVTANFADLESHHLTQIPYLDHFINETLRQYTPVASLFNRFPVQDVFLGEFLIPKNQTLDVNYMMSNYDPAIFEDPFTFNPERWAKPPKDTFAFTPFSSGQRNCIGQHMALLEMKTMLIYLVLNYELSLNSGKIILGLGNLYGPTRKDFLIVKQLNLQQ